MRLTRHEEQPKQGNQRGVVQRMEPFLPVAQPSPKGVRPRLSDEHAFNGILFVLHTGTPWEHLPLAVA